MVHLIPNILTFGRFVLTVIFIAMLLYSPQVENKSTFLTVAFVIFVVAGLTDIIDGRVARKYNVTTKFGRMVDPLADKILVCGSFISFAMIGQPKLYDLSPAHLAVIHWSAAELTSPPPFPARLRCSSNHSPSAPSLLKWPTSPPQLGQAALHPPFS